MKLIKTQTEFELSPTLAANEAVLERRATGQKVFHMGFGESPFPVAPRLKQALQEGAGRKEYLPTGGLPELRHAIQNYYQTKTLIDTDQFDVLVAPGSKLILYALQMAVEGDLIMPVPSWVSYAPQARLLGQNIIPIDTLRQDKYLTIDPADLKKTIHDARKNGLNPSKIILNYPNNPTGLTMTTDNLRDIAMVCREEGIFIISDEIYGFVNFENNYDSIAEIAPDITAVSSGLSKHLSLGGWRLGIGLIPKKFSGLYALLLNIASEMWSCVPAPIQQAAIAAYEGHSDIEDHIRACTDIHAFMNSYISQGLRSAGIIAPVPAGAFYNYPDFAPFREALIKKDVQTSLDLAVYLTQEYGLVSLPGTAFGALPSDLTLRIAGCDYDGAMALKAFQEGKNLDDNFVAHFAPNIKAEVEIFQHFTQELST